MQVMVAVVNIRARYRITQERLQQAGQLQYCLVRAEVVSMLMVLILMLIIIILL